MNILVISQYFWPESFRINDLTAQLIQRGHSVTVLTGIPNYPSGKFFEGYGFLRNKIQYYQGIKIVRVPLLPRGKGKGWRLALNYFSFAFMATFLAPFLCREKYDVIFVYEPSPVTVGLPAIFLRKWKQIPLLFWVQDLWPESLIATGAIRSKWILSRVRSLVRLIYRRCDLILVQSRAFVQQIQALGIKKAEIQYFPNSAEKFYQPISLDSSFSEAKILPLGFKVMFAGNIGAAQDFNTILNAAEKLKNQKEIHWVILGEGRLKKWVKKQIVTRHLSETVHLLGHYPVETMPRFFGLADALLVTLKKEPIFALTIPTKIQSYLACAKPIIAALDGEGSQVIEEAIAGFTGPAEDADTLASLVLKMYKLPEAERNQMGRNGRAYFENHFESSKLLTQLENWMQDLTQKNSVAIPEKPVSWYRSS